MTAALVVWTKSDVTPDLPWVTKGPQVEQFFADAEQARQFFLEEKKTPGWKFLFYVSIYEDGSRHVHYNHAFAHFAPLSDPTNMECLKCGRSISDGECPPSSVDP